MCVAARRVLVLAVMAVGLLAAHHLQAGGIPAETLKEIKAATVFVKCSVIGPGVSKPLAMTGSGFVMKVEGDTAYIATNEHVVTVPADFPRFKLAGPPTLVFHSGTPKEFSVTAEILAKDPSRDIAILRVTKVKDLPKAISLDPKLEVIETMGVFSFGFPFGQALSTTKGNPAMTIGKGSVSSIRLDEFGKIKVVQIDGELNPGNSGGPVVDDKGRLVGIAVAKISGTRIGMVIPPHELTAILLGRVGSVGITPVRMDKDGADLLVTASLIDPMRKMKSVSILHLPASELKEIPKISKEARFPPIKGATKLDLKMDDKGGADGKFSFATKQSGKVKIAFQTMYVNAEGDTIHTAVLFRELDFSGKFTAGTLAKDDPADKLTKNPFKLHTESLKSGKTYIIDMIGDPNVIDPFLRLEDSAGKEVAKDDDGGGGLNARIVYTPNKDDDFKIIATSFRGAGDYTLRIMEELPIQVGKGVVITSALTTNDPFIATARIRSHIKYFKVELKQGKTYIVEVVSPDFQPYVGLVGLKGVVVALDIAKDGDKPARFVHAVQEDGVYKLQVAAYDSGRGAFKVTIREGGAILVKDPKMDPKMDPKTYEVGKDGLTINSELTVQDGKDRKLKKSAARIFQVKLEKGQKYVIDMTSKAFDSFLRLEDAGGELLAQDDDSGGNLNARIAFTPKADGVYRLTALTLNGAFGDFTITVRKE